MTKLKQVIPSEFSSCTKITAWEKKNSNVCFGRSNIQSII